VEETLYVNLPSLVTPCPGFTVNEMKIREAKRKVGKLNFLMMSKFCIKE
jgi:hypothetical protein